MSVFGFFLIYFLSTTVACFPPEKVGMEVEVEHADAQQSSSKVSEVPL